MAADKPLTPESEKFARLLAVGVEQGEAYRRSGVGVLGSTVAATAGRPEIVARIRWLREHEDGGEADAPREPALDPKRVGKVDVIAMLLRDRELARSTGQASAAVRAGELIGKELGMFVDRKVVDLTILDKMSIDEQKSLLAALEELPAATAPSKTIN